MKEAASLDGKPPAKTKVRRVVLQTAMRIVEASYSIAKTRFEATEPTSDSVTRDALVLQFVRGVNLSRRTDATVRFGNRVTFVALAKKVGPWARFPRLE